MDTSHAPLLKRLVTKSAIWEVSSTFSNRTSAEGLKNLATAISATPKSLWGTRSLDITDKLKPSIKSHLSASKSQAKITFLPENPCWLTLDTLGWLMRLHLLTDTRCTNSIRFHLESQYPIQNNHCSTVDLVADEWHCHHSEAPGEDAWS